MTNARLIMFHKQRTSARTRFLRLAHGGVCGLEPLPEDAQIHEGDGGSLVTHPAMLLRAAERALRLPAKALEIEPGYRAHVQAESQVTEVFLAGFTTIDPPFEEARAVGAAFIDLTQARGLPMVELSLLRQAYEQLMG